MPAVHRDIVIEQGAKFVFAVQALHQDKTVFDLTGYSGRMQVRSNIDDTNILVDASTSNGRVSINAPGGIVTVTVGADITAAYTWKTGVYDLEVFTSNPAEVVRLAEGFATLSLEVTRP